MTEYTDSKVSEQKNALETVIEEHAAEQASLLKESMENKLPARLNKLSGDLMVHILTNKEKILKNMEYATSELTDIRRNQQNLELSVAELHKKWQRVHGDWLKTKSSLEDTQCSLSSQAQLMQTESEANSRIIATLVEL